jgi:uncharacterized protein (TIGR03435 family)
MMKQSNPASVMRILPIISLVAATGLWAQTVPEFEVADVQRSDRAMNPFTFVSGGVLRGDRYDLRKATMLDLIRIAYNVDPEMVMGGPNWLEFDRFDIAAKASASSSQEQIRLMLQWLLADRFKLVLHRDVRQMPAFVLAAGKTKPKISESDGTGDAGCQYEQQPAGSAVIAYACRNATMAAFAERLREVASDYIKVPVVNATGLDGLWDFELHWNRRSQVAPGGAERTTIFDAVNKQLGLSLTLQQAPAPVLVVDRVNEKPTDNPPDIARKLPPRVMEFEVADLKPSRPGEPGPAFGETRGGGLQARAIALRDLMAAAWDIDFDHPERFAGLPKWVESVKFDINAKTAASKNGPPLRSSGFIDDDVRLMLRNLLIERFQIKWHYEDRLVEAYSLVASKPGVNNTKLKKADPVNRAACKLVRNVANDPRDTNPLLSELLACRNVTIAQLAAKLQELEPNQFAYPVDDATGITGTFDFTLSFTRGWLMTHTQDRANGEASDPTGGISLADAISKQLGVKLEQRKRMLPVVVIDHIEEKPTDN